MGRQADEQTSRRADETSTALFIENSGHTAPAKQIGFSSQAADSLALFLPASIWLSPGLAVIPVDLRQRSSSTDSAECCPSPHPWNDLRPLEQWKKGLLDT